MQPKFCFLIFSVSLLLLTLACSGDGATVGGWQPIKNLNDAHVKEIAKFAVSEFNKQSNKNLKLNRIIKGEQQIVKGVKYRLIVNVKDAAESKSYEAIVVEKTWLKSRQLISFKPAN